MQRSVRVFCSPDNPFTIDSIKASINSDFSFIASLSFFEYCRELSNGFICVFVFVLILNACPPNALIKG